MKIIANNYCKCLGFPRSYAPHGNAFIESLTQFLTAAIPLLSIGRGEGKIGVKPRVDAVLLFPANATIFITVMIFFFKYF